ncbi:Regulator of sigma-E protease RseP [compost metagenome]
MDTVTGPIGIGQIAAEAFEEPGWFMFLQIMALISVNLAIINLLPVPILDGGHIVFASAAANTM